MTQLQTIELEILKEFIKACDKLGLTYYLVCGTALGAVKYSGFIPWDDDVDVALLRPDYELFCKNAQDVLPSNMFIQNYKTDPEFPQFFSKLRNSDTTYIESSVKTKRMNHGVYIDVFPLDGYPQNATEARWLERLKAIYKMELSAAYDSPCSKKIKPIIIAERAIGCHKRTQKIAKKIDSMISAYSVENSKLWCNHGNWQGSIEYAPKEQYGEGTWAEFEGLKVRIPKNYDEYLTQKYGNWRDDIPNEEKIGHHYYTICDLTKSYTHYIGGYI